MGQFLILLEASAELILRWLSHLFTTGLTPSLRWGPLRGRKPEEKLPSLQSIGNCFLHWELFTCLDPPYGFPRHSAALNATGKTVAEWGCLRFYWNQTILFMSWEQICIWSMRIRFVARLSNLRYYENVTCSFCCCKIWHFYNILTDVVSSDISILFQVSYLESVLPLNKATVLNYFKLLTYKMTYNIKLCFLWELWYNGLILFSVSF